jgi:hypothetical protein
MVKLENEEGRLRVRALFEEKPLTERTLELCRRYKPQLLAYLDFALQADQLLLESTHRLGAAWPAGCQLEDDEHWRQAERELHTAYWSQDLLQLENVISNRERVALELFAAHRKERAT